MYMYVCIISTCTFTVVSTSTCHAVAVCVRENKTAELCDGGNHNVSSHPASLCVFGQDWETRNSYPKIFYPFEFPRVHCTVILFVPGGKLHFHCKCQPIMLGGGWHQPVPASIHVATTLYVEYMSCTMFLLAHNFSQQRIET